jgi:hypothetical protein
MNQMAAERDIINSVWNKEVLSQQWKEPIIVPIDEKVDKIDCNNCRGISLLPTTKKLPNIFISVLTLYVGEFIENRQWVF